MVPTLRGRSCLNIRCHKILAIKLRSLGDTVLLTSPLQEILRVFPKAHLDVLVKNAFAPILEHFPGIQNIWTLSDSQHWTSLLWKLRKEQYDCVLNFHASSSSAFLARFTGAPHRAIHFHGQKDCNRFSTQCIPGKGTLKPILERDLDTLRAFASLEDPPLLPKIFLTPHEIETAKQSIQSLKPPRLGIHLGSSRPTKSWPIKNFAHLAHHWCHKKQGSAFILAGPQEEHLLSEFTHHWKSMVPDLSCQLQQAHQFNLRQISAILQQLSLFVGNDSGPKHMAIAVNTPTLTLFGPEHPFEWHPYDPQKHPYCFIDTLKCRQDGLPGMPAWCKVDPCIQEKHRCMTEISVENVFLKCENLFYEKTRS